LDEPLSNLGTKLRLEMRGEIKRLHADLGLTSIYVTHDQAEALSLSDRVVVLCDGRVIQAGTPAEIHDRPQTVFVADFMGYRNFFPLTVASEEGDTVLARGEALALRGRTVVPLRPGDAAVAAVRPEDVETTTEPPGPNVVRGTVRLTEYLGREHGVEVALEGGPTLTVRRAHPVTVGSALALRLPPHRVATRAAAAGSSAPSRQCWCSPSRSARCSSPRASTASTAPRGGSTRRCCRWAWPSRHASRTTTRA